MSKQSPQLVGIKEAAETNGISQKTVRRMIERGVITGYRSPHVEKSRVLIDPAQLANALRPQPIDAETFVA